MLWGKILIQQYSSSMSHWYGTLFYSWSLDIVMTALSQTCYHGDVSGRRETGIVMQYRGPVPFTWGGKLQLIISTHTLMHLFDIYPGDPIQPG